MNLLERVCSAERRLRNKRFSSLAALSITQQRPPNELVHKHPQKNADFEANFQRSIRNF